MGVEKSIPHAGNRVEFGNTRVEWVRVSELNRLKQTRQQYAPEGIAELAESMVYVDDAGNRQFELIHDLTIGVFTDDELLDYVADHEEFYGEAVDYTELTRAKDGLWYVAIAGHRRSLAIEENCAKAGVDLEDAFVASSLKRGIQFEEALVLQLRENVHLRPPAVDEAKQIDRYYRLRSRREHTAPTIASCARVLGFSESKVSEALRFARLPHAIQLEASEGRISYGHAVELLAYGEALTTYYARKYHETYETDATRSLASDVEAGSMVLVKRLKSEELRGANARKKSEIIKANVSTILEAASYHDGELFMWEEDIEPKKALLKAESRLGKQAIELVLHRLKTGMDRLSPIERQHMLELGEMLSAAKELAVVPDTDTADDAPLFDDATFVA